LPKKGQKKVTVQLPEDLYVEFSKRVIEEKKKLALSEKIVELIEDYLKE
jgi:metal-responsive CopG/Arc/MetJ family transcriptional regulator